MKHRIKQKKEYVYLSLIVFLLAIVIYQTFFVERVVMTEKEGQEFTDDFFSEEPQQVENQGDSSVRIRSYAYVQAQDGLIELPLENASARAAEMAVSIDGKEIFRSKRALQPSEAVIARLTEEEIKELGGDNKTVPFTARVIPVDDGDNQGTTGMGFGYRGTFLLN